MDKYNNYTKDILNYMGNKFRLLNFIIPEFKDYNYLVDVFGGGGSVFVNQNCKNVIYNDKLTPLYSLMKLFYENEKEKTLKDIKSIIKKYNITKTDKEAFLNLRAEWNQMEDKYSYIGLIMLYVIICHSFNYQLGFNKSGEFNVAFGNNRSSFNKALESRFFEFIEKMQDKKCIFLNLDFDALITHVLKITETVSKEGKSKILFYLDPPYLASDDSYSRTKSIKWGRECEKQLYEKCNILNNQGYKFVLSNVIENNGIENDILKEWVNTNNYIIKYPDIDYSNCNYQKDRKAKNIEVLIKNY